MTLLLLGSCSEFVAVAADRRATLVYPDGSVKIRDDRTNKAFCIICSNAKLICCWTGLAEVKGEPLDDWLIRILQDNAAGSLTGGELADIIAHHASKEMGRTLNSIMTTRHPALHEFLLAGWYRHPEDKKSAWATSISNYRNPDWSPLPKPSLRFGLSHKELFNHSWPGEKVQVYRGGAAGAVKDEDTFRLRRLLQQKPSDKAIASRMFAIIRSASKHPVYGKYVSQQSRAWVIRPSEMIHSFVWPESREGVVLDTPCIIRGTILHELRILRGKLGKLITNEGNAWDVAYVLDTHSGPISGHLGCADEECHNLLSKLVGSSKTSRLQLDNETRHEVKITSVNIDNDIKRYQFSEL